MQSNSQPLKIPLPFASSGSRVTIPKLASSIVAPGHASYDVGFPPLTFTPVESGGIPPFGTDFNGLQYAITNAVRWSMAGGFYTYDSAFANDANVNGYPRGALVLKAATNGYWYNTAENNVTDPDAGGAGWVDASAVFGGSGTGTVSVTDTISGNGSPGSPLVAAVRTEGTFVTGNGRNSTPIALNLSALDARYAGSVVANVTDSSQTLSITLTPGFWIIDAGLEIVDTGSTTRLVKIDGITKRNLGSGPSSQAFFTVLATTGINIATTRAVVIEYQGTPVAGEVSYARFIKAVAVRNG